MKNFPICVKLKKGFFILIRFIHKWPLLSFTAITLKSKFFQSQRDMMHFHSLYFQKYLFTSFSLKMTGNLFKQWKIIYGHEQRSKTRRFFCLLLLMLLLLLLLLHCFIGSKHEKNIQGSMKEKIFCNKSVLLQENCVQTVCSLYNL